MKLFYDLHIHSCLSPCGDNEMTPASIAGMAKVKGLDLIALTDHNSVRNCRAFCECCEGYGIVPVPGMELTTAEDIHIICLLPDIASAAEFGRAVDDKRIRIKNRESIFGEQLVVDANDNTVARDEFLLPNATLLSISEAYALARSFGAAVYPAHIDREANGIIASLGMLPSEPVFSAVEYRDINKREEYESKFPELASKKTVCSSDAHYLWDIAEREHFLELDVPENAGNGEIRESLIRYLQ